MSLSFEGIDTHAHIFRHDLPMASDRRYSPDYDALAEHYLGHLDRCSLAQGVLIQPSFLGTDNRFMVEALQRYPQRLRGIAVVEPDIEDAQLQALANAGVVGIRLNLIGKAPQDYIDVRWQTFYQRLARLGWQVEIQCGFDALVLVVPFVLASGVTVVVDHFGLPSNGIDPSNLAHQGFLALLGEDRLWVKLSAAYRSQSDLPRAACVLAQLRQACGGIDRFVWGSDWPHTQFESRTGYDAQLAFVHALFPDPVERRQVLVDNPTTLFGFAASTR
ncbi:MULTISPECIES: amidohydrolase family protein [unclassified Pseudomonas]|uniref:amidohydrolase family protein n=1 Tax=unclassified Pseudomonas TaxID=196821 RepID=UPI00166086D0|nr:MULTISPECIES: amidohydrolase family protein [unclassified Pseudomonas]MBD0705434.1 amidohydrolase [Pseudomonas sp. PSB1]MDR8385625.1 amidohydrolase family protein [Pseudomonas sp. JL2]